MTTPRNRLINLEATAYYHCINRCVRRAFLTGVDVLTGKDYRHRQQWIEDKMFFLAKIFAIDICAYAILDNHYHLVLHVNKKKPIEWTFNEIFTRWTELYKGHELCQRFLAGEKLDEDELLQTASLAAEYRRRLMSVSWFMRELNESTARRANAEDGCKGRFWESRFKSQALLDEAAIISCMAYVDLNPIRAGLYDTPEDSNFTSIQTRINQLLTKNQYDIKKRPLTPFAEHNSTDLGAMSTITLEQYISLVDWSGRVVRKDKAGSIPHHIPSILVRLEISENEWMFRTKHFQSRFYCVAGTWKHIKEAAGKFKRKWFHGKSCKHDIHL